MLLHPGAVRDLSALLRSGFDHYVGHPVGPPKFSTAIAAGDEAFARHGSNGGAVLPGTTVTWRVMLSAVHLGTSHVSMYGPNEAGVDRSTAQRLVQSGYGSVALASRAADQQGRQDFVLLDTRAAVPAYLVEYEFRV
jgi:hypothetical protein